jgi:fatty-acyl-CoA synthase
VDADGYFSIEGRKKEMFVSGGENVYPAEVEDAISAHDDVSEVVVVPVPDEEWGQAGRAVVEPSGTGEPFSLSELGSFLDGRLARYKHPRSLVFVDAIPTSGPEKIDREAVKTRYGE